MMALQRYLRGWCQYYRHGESTRIFAALDRYVIERVARNYARSQPSGKKRKRRPWQQYRRKLEAWEAMPSLLRLRQQAFRAYRGEANTRWRAV